MAQVFSACALKKSTAVGRVLTTHNRASLAIYELTNQTLKGSNVDRKLAYKSIRPHRGRINPYYWRFSINLESLWD